MNCFDIRPFALPKTPADEVRFEDPRDITEVVVTFAQPAPDGVGLSYLHKTWPDIRLETIDPAARTHHTGWFGIDDWFNSKWRKAAIDVKHLNEYKLSIKFKGLHAEMPEVTDFDVTYRRTLGVKVESGRVQPSMIEVYTNSPIAHSDLRVQLDAGKQTPVRELKATGYNCVFEMKKTGERTYELAADHMTPHHHVCYDEGLITFELDGEAFTISLDSLAKQGPVWFEDQGVFITQASDKTTFEQYLARNRDSKTIADRVMEQSEQSYSGAMHGQPRPHPCACTVGCKHARQRFWLEPNGDIMTIGLQNLIWIEGPDTKRMKLDSDGRLMFDLDRWQLAGRHFDPSPVMAYNTRLMRGDVTLEQKTFAAPLEKSIFDDVLGDDSIVCLSRFTFMNKGDEAQVAELPISYSANTARSLNRLDARDSMDDHLIWNCEREKLSLSRLATDCSGDALLGVRGEWHGESVLRCAVATKMEARQRGDGLVLRKELAPGESCEVVVKMPFIAIDQPNEIAALAALDYEKCYADVRKFWRKECAAGAHVHTGEPNLDALYKSHVAHIELTDSRMPAEPELINTSVGSSTYGNYANESVMIVEELDERGLHDMARRRINVWLQYQGTVGLKGLFTDHDGVFFGAAGYEKGDSYDQHHGWVLWCIARHFFITGDSDWMRGVADKLVKGVEWVHRQRKEAKKELPHSRGWEYGFLAAGALEDVDDYFYWLSTNALTWRGVEWAARALKAIDHPKATEVRAEADDYKKCLINGFETMRRHTPLVRLKDGRWIPNYSSRLYRRGRDMGWIREMLEGSVYLLISGLYDCDSKQARWILDDFADNRYMNPNYSYPVYDPENSWIDYGGFSNQPNLLAGLIPHLDRDEPEAYIWSFFNAWAACYREEINAMVEHPQPILGFSNSAIYKTSDQANAIKWLRYMFVYAHEDLLHFGRAIPREWFREGNDPSAEGVATHFGQVSVSYRSEVASGSISATVDLPQRVAPGRCLVRFRHPEKLAIESVTINGAPYGRFDAKKGDVDVTGLKCRLEIRVSY